MKYSNYEEHELIAGLVIHQETEIFPWAGGCYTNARIVGDKDYAVRGDHLFLVIGRDAVNGVVTALPLYSKKAPGSISLLNLFKKGPSKFWRANQSFFSAMQYCVISFETMMAAALNDNTTPDNRRTYAKNDRGELARICSHLGSSVCNLRKFK